MKEIQTATEGSPLPDASIQVLAKFGFVGSAEQVVQMFVTASHRGHIPPGSACVWLTKAEARELGRALIDVAEGAT